VIGDPESSAADLDRTLTEARRVLAATRSPAAASDSPDPSARGTGLAAEGLVRASAAPGGRLESVTVDPRLLREGLEAICEHIVAAVNAAFDDLRAQASAAPDAGVDTAALSARLQDLQDSSVRQMAMFTQAMNDVVARLRETR
jgi:DNA-binding protein YbaB